jgi:Raf kinase inhibitor-like YbhB/YbcL family protein
MIPAEFTCDGANKNPPLNFEAVSPDAKSLVLIMEDPDVPRDMMPSGVFDHWVVFNISPKVTGVAAHTGMSAAVDGVEGKALGTLGANSAGPAVYTGPCPPDREHRYFFRLYALDTQLALKKGAKKEEVLSSMEGHVLAKAELMGKYNRPQNQQ